MHAECEMGADAAQRGRSVEISAWEIEAVARPEQRLNQGWLLGSFLNVSLSIGPRLITQRRLEDRSMNPPPLLAFDLQDKDVVHIVVSAEALVLGRSDVRVCLYGMAEFGGEPLTELENWRPDAMQGLQHQS